MCRRFDPGPDHFRFSSDSLVKRVLRSGNHGLAIRRMASLPANSSISTPSLSPAWDRITPINAIFLRSPHSYAASVCIVPTRFANHPRLWNTFGQAGLARLLAVVFPKRCSRRFVVPISLCLVVVRVFTTRTQNGFAGCDSHALTHSLFEMDRFYAP